MPRLGESQGQHTRTHQARRIVRGGPNSDSRLTARPRFCGLITGEMLPLGRYAHSVSWRRPSLRLRLYPPRSSNAAVARPDINSGLPVVFPEGIRYIRGWLMGEAAACVNSGCFPLGVIGGSSITLLGTEAVGMLRVMRLDGAGALAGALTL